MTYFTIVRHGETVSNVAGIVQSVTPGELTEAGTRMAQILGKRLENEIWTHIYSSDLKRCQDTTQGILLQQKSGQVPPVHYTPKLRERDYGSWEGEPTIVVRTKQNLMGLPFHKNHQVDIPNGETYPNCKARAGNFFDEILQLAEAGHDKNILVVSHGVFISCFVEYLLENPDKFKLINFEDKNFEQRAGNTCLTRFSITKLAGENSAKFCLDFSHFFDVEHLKEMS